MPEVMNADVDWTAGDPLFLKGTITGAELPDPAAWVGATAKLKLVNVDSGAVVLNDVAMTSFNTTTRAYEYRGAALAEANYEYVIKVTFADASLSPLTFPNNRKLKLRVVAAL